ncbi:hypothetical protein [Oscillatoria acuminata]|uniref:Uncharacterized protein n=1 Tax=Oscillatoria acuminata PCC 6304 TaxID=56110 RepID=K9TJC1_9CYAN|nr:hypothetical protein [Oscillatoria acuminata]AFY82119.1 hypothetical protein Oscil6304_2500 [Oscillatoria acuminata PCC 6304]
MAASKQLQGIELIDCAKANAEQGLATAAELSGYGQNTRLFSQELKAACQDIGIEISELSDLITHQHEMKQGRGIDIAPETPGNL